MAGSSMWSDKVGNVSQVGGIETSVLDNGPGRGMRIAWINTGAGLRYKVLLDRAMDIGDAVFNQYNLAWLSHAGFTPPQSLSDKGLDWLRTFGGGLMSTCGLTHVGGPEKDEHGERGIHGRISNTPAEIVSIIQPDPAVGKMDMSITGIIRESNIFGPCLELRRTITSKLGEASIHIKDEVINRGNTTAPHMLMYHCNFGWPLADKGSRLSWNGVMTTRDGQPFPDADAYMICRDTLPEHNGNGEQVAFIDIAADDEGICRAGLHNPSINLGVTLSFRKSEMPWLTNWQHFGRGEYVTGIEPCTHPPIGQAAARANNTLLLLQPGETKTYHLTIDINL